MTKGEISCQIRDERGKWDTLGDATDIAVEYYNKALEALEATIKAHEPHDDRDWRWIVTREIRALKVKP